MLQLITPDISHKSQWEEIMYDWWDTARRPRIFFQESFEVFFQNIEKLAQWDDIERQISKSSIFFLMNSEDNRILGFFWLRHHLGFRDDIKYWGHIGYWIRLSERWKWYAKYWLKLILQKARDNNIWDKVLLACDDNNIASTKVIEANGWILESYNFAPDGIKRRRYWIDLYVQEKEQLKSLEIELLQSGTRHNQDRINILLADDFFECGKSGDQFGKKECLYSLSNEDTKKTLEYSNMTVHMLSENLWRVRFLCTIQNPWESPTTSYRSSLWRKSESWWQMFFHQGTLISNH